MMGYEALVKAVDSYDSSYGVPLGAWVVMQCKGVWSSACRSSDALDHPLTQSLSSPVCTDSDDDRTLEDTIASDYDLESTMVRDMLMGGYMETVRAMISNLPDAQRAVIEAVYIDGESLSSMGPRAASHLRRGLAAIRRELVKRGMYHGGEHYESV